MDTLNPNLFNVKFELSLYHYRGEMYRKAIAETMLPFLPAEDMYVGCTSLIRVVSLYWLGGWDFRAECEGLRTLRPHKYNFDPYGFVDMAAMEIAVKEAEVPWLKWRFEDAHGE